MHATTKSWEGSSDVVPPFGAFDPCALGVDSKLGTIKQPCRRKRAVASKVFRRPRSVYHLTILSSSTYGPFDLYVRSLISTQSFRRYVSGQSVQSTGE